MKPKIEFFLNSIGLLILSPIMGMMAVVLAVVILRPPTENFVSLTGRV